MRFIGVHIWVHHPSDGLLDNSLKKYTDAIHYYSRAIILDPECVNAYYNRGIANYLYGNYTDAISDLSTAITINSRYKKAYLARAKVYRILKDDEKAQRDEIIASRLS